jgi:hypothetical protein
LWTALFSSDYAGFEHSLRTLSSLLARIRDSLTAISTTYNWPLVSGYFFDTDFTGVRGENKIEIDFMDKKIFRRGLGEFLKF